MKIRLQLFQYFNSQTDEQNRDKSITSSRVEAGCNNQLNSITYTDIISFYLLVYFNNVTLFKCLLSLLSSFTLTYSVVRCIGLLLGLLGSCLF